MRKEHRVHGLLPVILALLIALSLVLPSCRSSQNPPPDTELTTYAHLSISRLPKLAQTAEITLSVAASLFEFNPSAGRTRESLTNARAWVEVLWVNTNGSYHEARYGQSVPLTDVLVSGNLAWQGNYLEERISELELQGEIRLPKEGIWIIKGSFSGEGWRQPEEAHLWLAVTKDASAQLGTEEIESSPLAYLTYFAYAMGGVPALSEAHPVKVELDMSKLPTAGENVTVSCTLESLYDIPEFYARLKFIHGVKVSPFYVEVPGSSLLTHGLLEWKGSLDKGKPVTFAATVRFPEEGEWHVYAMGDTLENTERLKFGYADNMKFTIASIRPFYGWIPKR